MGWIRNIRDKFYLKIFNDSIIYVTNKPIKIRKNDDYSYDIQIGGRTAIRVLRVSNEQSLRGYRASLGIYDSSVEKIDWMINRIDCMSLDGVVEHLDGHRVR